MEEEKAVEIIQAIVFQPLTEALSVPWGLMRGVENGLQPVGPPKVTVSVTGSEKGSHFYCLPALSSLGCTNLPERALLEDQDFVQAPARARPCEAGPQGCDCIFPLSWGDLSQRHLVLMNESEKEDAGV